MRFSVLPALLALAACSGTPAIIPTAGHVPVPGGAPVPAAVGTVQGQDERALRARFGQPQLDVTEGAARKLQFAGPICVLDAYLYPPRGGRGEPVVTFVDTRQRDGSPIDPASCVAALAAAR